jgi:integrase
MSKRPQTVQTQILKTMDDIPINRQVCVALARGTKNLAAAESQTQAAGKTSPSDIKGKIIAFLWQLERNGRAKGTIKNYSRLLNGFLKANIDLFNPESVKDYLAKMPLQTSSKQSIVGMLNVWYRFLKISWEPPKYTIAIKSPFIPTEQELDQLIAICGPKTATFCQLAKETGARAGELANLTWNDIDFERRIVKITAEKGSLPRILPLSLKAIEMLNNIRKNADSNRIFNLKSIYVNFHNARKHAAKKLANPRILQIRFHTFRHWKATMEYHKTKDILHVKEILGHKTIESTQIYIHIEKAIFLNTPPEEYHVKIAKTPEEITQLLETGFEYVLQKDGLTYFRKRK